MRSRWWVAHNLKYPWSQTNLSFSFETDQSFLAQTVRELKGIVTQFPIRRPTPGKFYKGRSQEKTQLRRPEIFLLLSPLDRARSVLTYRAMCSVAGQCDPVVGVFSTSGFHRFLATKPVSSETSKAERWSIWRP